MTLGLAQRQGDLLDGVTRFCDEAVPQASIYALLHRERDRLFPDELFADLFSDRGRRSVPPSVVATVMVLQRLEGLSDREAVERFAFDVRWRYAAAVGGYDHGARVGFVHTVLVDMRERLRCSQRPDRVFEVGLEAARAAGLVGRRRVLDSTPLYDAVATMDTVTLMRSAIRGLLAAADAALEAELRAALRSGDDYATAGKPQIDWDDRGAREALVDSRARDGYACLGLLDGRQLDAAVAEAARLLAAVLGQDLEVDGDGRFRIARRVAKDRVISTVDPQARHGHKTRHRGFDGYKGHAAADPDSEIITATKVTPGNASDGSVAADLIADLLGERRTTAAADADADDGTAAAAHDETAAAAAAADDGTAAAAHDETAAADADADDGTAAAAHDETAADDDDAPTVYGDNAYGTGEFQSDLEDAGMESRCKTQPPAPLPGGLFNKDRFTVDLDDDTVTCPAGVTARIRRGRDGAGIASFGGVCADCPLRGRCTTSPAGRSIHVGVHEAALARARARQADPAWQADYRATRPKIERKLAHLVRRKHGGRRARVRGTDRIDADFRLGAAAVNLARLAVLGLRSSPAGWATGTA